MTSSTESARLALGTRCMKRTPWLVLLMPPRDPTLEKNASTFGSWRTMALRTFWCSTMLLNEIPSAASVKEKTCALSSLGRKPIGMIRNSATVATRIRRDATIVASGRRRTNRRLDSYRRSEASKTRSEAA